MQNMYRISCVVALVCLAGAQEYIDFPALPYQHGNNFYQSPGFPPHFRPFGYHNHGYQPYNKPIGYPSVYQDFHNDVRLPNPYVSDYPNFYQNYPQFDERFQHLDNFHKPAFREPIQLIPSRFPPRIENIVERIQNHFSVYNPGLIIPNSAITPILVEIPNNATSVSTTTPTPETSSPTTVQNESSSTEAVEETATEETNQSEETTESTTEPTTNEP